jgi:uncharacterized protein YjbI with pentapeptide repeats
MANEERLARLKQGVDAWNAWRDENPSIEPHLTEANLTEANLSRAFLTMADLREAHLGSVDPSGDFGASR